tara:strand:+ start:496 stop:906 length:411 start_codon:yes stop_codon:yes gene_type:complete
MDIDYSESYLKKILSEVKTIAIVGASSKNNRDSFKVMHNLIENGYKVIPINPNESGKIILGEECLTSLDAIEENVDMVDVFRANSAIIGVTKEAIKIGAKVLWMQEGIIHHEAANLAKDAGLKVIMDRCPKNILEN